MPAVSIKSLVLELLHSMVILFVTLFTPLISLAYLVARSSGPR
jgi:hypothetical protein